MQILHSKIWLQKFQENPKLRCEKGTEGYNRVCFVCKQSLQVVTVFEMLNQHSSWIVKKVLFGSSNKCSLDNALRK